MWIIVPRNEAAVIPNRDLAALPVGNTALLPGDRFQSLQVARRPQAGGFCALSKQPTARPDGCAARSSLRTYLFDMACRCASVHLALEPLAKVLPQLGLRGDDLDEHPLAPLAVDILVENSAPRG